MKALIFDLDDTLVVEKASAEAAFLETCELARARYGIEPGQLHAAVRRTCRDIWHKSPARAYCVEIGISSWEGMWARFEGPDENLRILRDWGPSYRKNSWYEALREHGVEDADFAAELAAAFRANRCKRHIVYGDVRLALEQCRQSYRLGMLTNGAPDLQRHKIDAAAIGEYFDAIVISGEVGVGKPNARIYGIMLSRLGVTADDVVMIGNSLKSDVQGAQAVGIRAVWVNRAGESRDGNIVPDLEVSNLAELSETLRRGDVWPDRSRSVEL
jgi:putative hydrolase of the HAD superfamily